MHLKFSTGQNKKKFSSGPTVKCSNPYNDIFFSYFSCLSLSLIIVYDIGIHLFHHVDLPESRSFTSRGSPFTTKVKKTCTHTDIFSIHTLYSLFLYHSKFSPSIQKYIYAFSIIALSVSQKKLSSMQYSKQLGEKDLKKKDLSS